MRALVQRVARASVTVNDRVVASIGRGFLVFLGVHEDDTPDDANALAAKVAGLRVFEDAEGKMNLDLAAIGGSVLCVSQFTLYGDLRRGRRPSFTSAARSSLAEQLYERFCDEITAAGVRCERGIFGAHMDVELVNDGPVTLWLDSDELARSRRSGPGA